MSFASWAQQDTQADDTGGLVATLDVSQSLNYSSNPNLDTSDDPSLSARTGLTLGLDSRTRVDNFRLRAGGFLEFGDRGSASSDSVLEDPFASLSYGRATRNARFNLSADIRASDVSDSVLLDELSNQDLIFDNGTLVYTGITAGFETGLEADFGVAVNVYARQRDYLDTLDPRLFDSQSLGGSVQLSFRIDPRLTTTVFGNFDSFEGEGAATDRETLQLGVGVQAEVTPRLTASAQLFYSRVKVEESIVIASRTRTETGLGASLGLDYAMPNGALTLNLTSDVEENGRRATLRVGRSLELPTGALSFSVGGVRSDRNDFDPLFEINYAHALPRGDFTVVLTQTPTNATSAQETVSSELDMTLTQTINSRSSWSTGLEVLDVDFVGGLGANDSRRYNFNATYRHALAQDWNVVGGFTHSRLAQGNASARKSNALFVRLEKQFSFRP